MNAGQNHTITTQSTMVKERGLCARIETERDVNKYLFTRILCEIPAEVCVYYTDQVKRGGSRTRLAINARNFAAQLG